MQTFQNRQTFAVCYMKSIHRKMFAYHQQIIVDSIVCSFPKMVYIHHALSIFDLKFLFAFLFCVPYLICCFIFYFDLAKSSMSMSNFENTRELTTWSLQCIYTFYITPVCKIHHNPLLTQTQWMNAKSTRSKMQIWKSVQDGWMDYNAIFISS